MLSLFILCNRGILSTGSWLMILTSGDLTIPGCLLSAFRMFTNSVPLMIAVCSKVTRYVPSIRISGPPSVLTWAVASLIITTPSSTGVIVCKWLGCVWHCAEFPAWSECAHDSRRFRSQNVWCVVSMHPVTAKVSSSHSARVSSSRRKRMC